MANIRPIYDDAAMTNQVYPQTHERAVVDNNGTTAETKFQMITDLVNQKQMEIGAVPSDLTPTEGSANWVTSGGLYNQLNVGDANVEIDLSEYTAVRAFPSPDLWIVTNDTYPYYGMFVSIEPNLKYRLKANESQNSLYAFLTTNTYSHGATVSYATGCTRELVTADTEIIDTAPNDARYLWICTYTDSDRTPQKVEIYNKRSLVEIIEDTDSVPTENSENLVISGGVWDEFSKTVTNSSDSALASLDISDSEGYVIARFAHGHIKTKNFDSEENTICGGYNEDEYDLDITDEYGNVIVRFNDGHIKTKNFNSALNGSALPDYWKTYLDNKKSELINAELSIGKTGASFIFITDVHWDDNHKVSPSAIAYIRQITQVKDVICGGDIIVGHGERNAKIAEMLDWNEKMKQFGCINLVGNHDYNTSDQPYSTWDTNRIKAEEHYRMNNAETEKIVLYDGTTEVNVSESGYKWNSGRYPEYFGYTDNQTQKIRYIFLDSTCVHSPYRTSGDMTSSDLRLSDNQLLWMQERITELGEGWTVLVFTHIFFYGGTPIGLSAIGTQIQTALDNIYESCNATIAGVISGHCHHSYSAYSEKGYPIIATTCDARANSAQLIYDDVQITAGGTVAEQAFDIYYVNTEDRTIDVIRIGAGDTDSNRSFTY